jgi:hypothetical protein
VRRPRGQEGARPRRGRLGFAAGILLMGASFLVYPAYPVLVMLPATGGRKVEAAAIAAALSWVVFAGGLVLAGRRGWVWLRRRWRGRGGRGAPPPGARPPC